MTIKAPTAALCLVLAISAAAQQQERNATRRWTEVQAQTWAGAEPWTLGCNYIPRTAVNTLEMWQAETFDPAAIDEELGWAEDLGFNAVRVFLHYLLWDQDSGGFLRRMERFLAIADKHHIATMFVLFDD
ncbi:MAG: 1,4-beta-xylanase, partial [Candidatus Aminicenantes bacterium]